MLVGHSIPRLAGNALNWSLARWMGKIFVMKSQWSSCKVNRSRGCHACNEAGEGVLRHRFSCPELCVFSFGHSPSKITEAGAFGMCTAAHHQGATNVSSLNGAAWWILQLERSSPWCWIHSSEEQLLLFAPVLWRKKLLNFWLKNLMPNFATDDNKTITDSLRSQFGGFTQTLYCTKYKWGQPKNAQIHWNFFWGSKIQLHYNNIYYWFLFLFVRRL